MCQSFSYVHFCPSLWHRVVIQFALVSAIFDMWMSEDIDKAALVVCGTSFVNMRLLNSNLVVCARGYFCSSLTFQKEIFKYTQNSILHFVTYLWYSDSLQSQPVCHMLCFIHSEYMTAYVGYQYLRYNASSSYTSW